jgi:hypothetical protein
LRPLTSIQSILKSKSNPYRKYSIFRPFQPKIPGVLNENSLKHIELLDEKKARSFPNLLKITPEYRLVYIIPNERIHLVSMGLLKITLLFIFLPLTFLIFAERFGLSRLEEVIDDFNLYAMTLYAWIMFVFVIVNCTLRHSILRIYYNQSKDKFLLVGSNYRFKYFKEDFSPDTFSHNMRQQSISTQILTKANPIFGNCLVNGKRRYIDFQNFKSDEILKKLIGAQAFHSIVK